MTLIFCALSSARAADPPPAPLTTELDRTLAAIDTLPKGPDRNAALLRADELRARLIDLAPTDARTPTLLIDRAAFQLARLGDDGADTSTLVGLPTFDQKSRVRDAARLAMTLLDKATASAQTATATLESQILDRSGTAAEAADRAAAAETSLHTLVDIEQAQRIPYLTAQCRVLLAASGGAAELDSNVAQSAAAALQHVRARTAPLDAARDVLLVCAVINSTPALRDKARDTMDAKLRAVLAGDAAEPATRRRARLAMLVLGLSPPALAPDAPWEDRLADAEALARRAIISINPSSPTRWTQSGEALLPVLTLAREPAPTPEFADARRSLVYFKAANAVDPKAPPSSLPPEINLARAVAILRETTRPSPPAEELLDDAAARTDASPDVRADALWELGVALDRRRDDPAIRPRQIATLGRLLTGFATHPRSAAAAQWLASNAAPDWNCLSQPDRSRARTCAPVLPEFIRAVRSLSTGPDAARWILESLRIELWTTTDAPTLKGVNAAIERWHQLPPAPAPEQQAGARDIAAAAVILSQSLATRPATDTEAADRIILLTPLVAFLTAQSLPAAPTLALCLAEARLVAGDPDAAPAFQPLIGSPIDRPATREAARIRLGLAQALRDADRSQEAFVVLRELAEQFEKAPGEKGRDEAYWTAWATMLEMISQSGDQSRSDEILKNISRLELIDPKLGSGPTADRIRKVRERVAR